MHQDEHTGKGGRYFIDPSKDQAVRKQVEAPTQPAVASAAEKAVVEPKKKEVKPSEKSA